MKEFDYDAMDAEVITMVNGNRPRAGRLMLVNEEKVKQMDTFYQEQAVREQRIRKVDRAVKVAMPVGLGFVTLGALGNDLMDPVLAVVILLGCLGWAGIRFWRERNG